jgi:hypothetical protein
MVDHAWVQENLDTYLAGDLTTNERENVERHVAACEACKQALAEARRLEQVMNGLFADARPDANLEDRVIRNLGKEPVRAFQRPSLRRFVAAAAAVLVVGLVGFAAQAISTEGGFPFAAVNLSSAMHDEGMPLGGARADAGRRVAVKEGVAQLEKELADRSDFKVWRESYKPTNSDTSILGDDTDIQFKWQRIAEPSAPGYVNATEAIGSKDGDGLKRPPGKGFSLGETGKERTFDGRGRGDEKDSKGLGNGPNGLPALGHFFDRNRPTTTTGTTGSPKGIVLDEKRHDYKEAESKLTKDLDMPDKKKDVQPGEGLWSMNDLKSNLFLPPPGNPGPIAKSGDGSTPPSPTGPAYFPMPLTPPSTLLRLPDFKKGEGDDKESPKGDKSGQEKFAAEVKSPGPDTKKPSDPKITQKPLAVDPPIETNRKIIRTGEMEFETDSFDKSVEKITLLITGVKGGFVATINSDKLPNGKMRGSIVVRMPPQFLDKFVLDLRRELAKSGELKNQRIISLDVTKQYTDIESRLRAARTMEDRLIQIIKIGKGEIKDLVAAERELGIWRTKIEEMEGEIRYYANQVSLSTLTITLYEKEILAPTAIVVTETVRMRLEVDDVAKAHQTAMNAVEEVKGRITRSELKQHSAGQLQSILFAEIPPAKKDAFRDKLKTLGIVSAHEENQSQHTEGGIGRGSDLKPRASDVHFDVTMHNTANVRPRLAADLKIATDDVPAAYAKLLDEIAAHKGQVRDGKLNEQDKLNITALLDFNVPSSAKPEIDKVIADIGPVLERINVRAPVSELSTDRKFGYTLLLRDFASIPPSKAIIEIISAADVPASYAKIQEAIAKAKGQIADARLNEQDKLNVNAQIDFTVPSEEKQALDKLLAELGTSLSRTNVQAPMKQLSTARKFGYTLVLRDFASIPPSKATELKVAVSDVPATFAKLVEAIAKAKGKVDAKLNEQDKLNITAHLAFSVPSEEKSAIDKLLADLGTVLSRNDVQAPVNQLSTAKKFGYSLDLRDFAAIPPSQASEVKIAASNVPGNYAKLLEAIASAKGQVRDAKLNEQDKLNVIGQIDFTVPSAEKPAIEKLLADIGTMLSRNNVQAPVSELSTDRKFGYSVVLRDFANIPPRETFILQVALNDVPATFREFQQAVAQAKGWVSVGKLVEDNKAKIEAQFDFDVPAAEKPAIEKALAKAGAVMSRTSSQVPVNDLATDQKVGYRLTLRSTASIPPREIVRVKFEVADVDGKATELKELILAGKGRVVDSSIDRYENGQAAAVLVFEVPFASQDTLIRQMKVAAAGKLVSQKTMRNAQVPENELTTVHVIVTLTGANPIVPNDEGITSSIRTSLYLSFKILAFIVMSIVVGLSGIVPCVVMIWIGFKLYAVLTAPSQGRPTLPALSTGSKLIADDDKPADGDPSAKS